MICHIAPFSVCQCVITMIVEDPLALLLQSSVATFYEFARFREHVVVYRRLMDVDMWDQD